MDKTRNGIRSWLQIQPAVSIGINITEALDYNGNAAKNRIWYRGDSSEIEQLYKQINTINTRYCFWSATPSPGMEINKIHTGMPSLIVDTISNITLSGLNDFIFQSSSDKEIWEKVEKENKIKKKLEKAVKETLYIGDGAFKLSFDPEISDYPIIEFYPGDRIEIVAKRGRVVEIIFKSYYSKNGKNYELLEHYGYGYVKYNLMLDGKEVSMQVLEETKNLTNIGFSTYKEDQDGNMLTKGTYMLAVPTMFFESSKWENRGMSIYDKKTDAFDSLDEAWSQWMDALRSGRTREYIPECLLPRNPETGQIVKPNAFDNRFIATDTDMREDGKNVITVQQPEIPHESYLSTYITALELCIQGLLSPSTIGIDVKKLDNADAQREKEKVTMYTRNSVVDALKEDLQQLIKISVMSYKEIRMQQQEEVEVEVSFEEYANPSFESQVETVGKAKTTGIMSIEAVVDELYGDTKDEEWKEEEVRRIKNEQGIVELEEPAVSMEIGGVYDSNNTEADVSHEYVGGKENVKGN